MRDTNILLYTKSLSGHRGSYCEFLKNIIPNSRVIRNPIIFGKETLFFLLIEDGFFEYFYISVIRALLGKKTVGLCFQPGNIAETAQTFKTKLKKTLLLILKSFSNIRTISIVPNYCFDVIDKYMDDYIYDFQFWDLSKNEKNNVNKQNENKDTKKKIILSALGTQNYEKGFDKFVNTFVQNQEIREKFSFVYAGRITLPPKYKQAFESHGGQGIDQKVSDAKLLEQYGKSDLVWCHYAISYNQASGIFGRALQLGVPALVRSHSVIETICLEEKIPHLSLTNENLPQMADCSLPIRFVDQAEVICNKFKSHSIEVLAKNLNVSIGETL